MQARDALPTHRAVDPRRHRQPSGGREARPRLHRPVVRRGGQRRQPGHLRGLRPRALEVERDGMGDANRLGFKVCW